MIEIKRLNLSDTINDYPSITPQNIVDLKLTIHINYKAGYGNYSSLDEEDWPCIAYRYKYYTRRLCLR